MNKLFVIILLSALFSFQAFSQSEKGLIRKGNKQYKEGAFDKAEVDYQKATEQNPRSDKAFFNLGNARYQQQSFEDATNHFSRVAEMSNNPKMEAKALFNAGNSLMSQEKYAESIPMFKQALRLDPDDEEARYNLSYAMWKMQQQEQQQDQNQDQNKDQNQDDQKDQEKQDEQSQDQQDNEQQQNEQNDEKSDQKQQQSQQPQMSKEDAERMLQALTGEEKKTLEKLNENRVKTGPRSVRDKDW
ncbi:MAG: tetratricopeptide repeat protein [Bacteroidetes bacterium]|nr:tetratricopeptide repeat protein [Bacteroidota bacterium]